MKASPSLIPRLKREEGFSAFAYWDDAPGGGPGHWSIGYGSEASGPDDTITEPEAEKKLLEKLAEAESNFSVIFQTEPPGITQARYDSILDMLYNLGLSRFSEFVYTIASIRAGDWVKAAAHAQQSLWYRQVGNRAKQIVSEIRTGIGECDRTDPVPQEVPKDKEGATIKKASAWDGMLEFFGRLLRLVRCGYQKNLRGGGLT